MCSVKVGSTRVPLAGFVLCASVFFAAFLAQIPVFLCYLWSKIFDQGKRRRGVDRVIGLWAKGSMSICGCSEPFICLGMERTAGRYCYVLRR